MKKTSVPLIEIAADYDSLLISPMLASFDLTKEAEVTHDAHRHTSYGLFLLRSGELTMMVQGNEVLMHSPSLMLVQPGQVHQSIASSGISGWVMFFDGKSVDSRTRAIIEQSVDQVAVLRLSDDELSFTDQLMGLVYHTSLNKGSGSFDTKLVHSLINALLYKVAGMQVIRRAGVTEDTSRAAQIVQQFKDLIKLHYKTLKRPASYASLLNVSVSHLNDTVKAHTGCSATYLLQQEIIGNAQRQLRHSARSGKEIAFDLGYHDHKYFIRLFTKVVGQSPSVFRKTAKLPTEDRGGNS